MHLVPEFGADFGDRCEATDAGVHAQHVDRAQPLTNPIESRVAVGDAGNVAADGNRTGLRRDLLQRTRITSSNRKPRTLGCKADRGCPAYSTVATEDGDGLPLEAHRIGSARSHRCFLVVRQDREAG